MRISKRQLKRIIKEEKRKLLRERDYGGFQKAKFVATVGITDLSSEFQDAEDMEQQFIDHMQKFDYVPSAHQPGDHTPEYEVEAWMEGTD